MGCGKSSVGRRLSELLCCPFMDLDDVIVESAGRSIPEIFATEGEPSFRQMELEALKQIITPSVMSQCAPLAPSHFVGPSPYAGVRKCQFRTSVSSPEDNMHRSNNMTPSLVLALGGGAVMTKECAEIVKEQTCCVYLKASIETLVEHLSGEADGRPMLHGKAASQEGDTSLRGAERRGNPLQKRIAELMAQRRETYEKTAHAIIDTDGKSVEAIASEIVSMLNI